MLVENISVGEKKKKNEKKDNIEAVRILVCFIIFIYMGKPVFIASYFSYEIYA